MTSDLVAKYDVSLPRYTSYPSVPYWKGLSEQDWKQELRRQIQIQGPAVSVYVHVPYCATPCTFCGCTRIISRNKNLADEFVPLLLKEAQMKLESWEDVDPILSELHVGGGTPNWLPPEALETLLSRLTDLFDRQKFFTFSVELDPRTLTREHVKALGRLGVNRVSLGVQDFHVPTLEAIRRPQKEETVRRVVDWLRDEGIQSINFDLVYGLPFQTPETLHGTAQTTAEILPHRIALYGYAHVPSMRPAQRQVEKFGLPEGAEKRALSQSARDVFVDAGYREIGFDHFALSGDELWQAQKAKKLYRNFMGYTVSTSPLLLGLGPSSLSDCGTAYAQNPKEVDAWKRAVLNFEPLTVKGHLLSPQEAKIKNLILEILCQMEGRVPDEMMPDSRVRSRLDELRGDGIIREVVGDPARFEVTPIGRGFLRNIAAVFDPYLSNQNSRSAHSRNA